MEKKPQTSNKSVIRPLNDSPSGSLGGPHRLHCPKISFIYSKLSGIFSCILLHGLAYNRNSFALISVTKCNKASQTCRIFRFRSSKALGYSFQEKEELQSFPQQRTFASLALNSWPAAVFLHYGHLSCQGCLRQRLHSTSTFPTWHVNSTNRTTTWIVLTKFVWHWAPHHDYCLADGNSVLSLNLRNAKIWGKNVHLRISRM